MNEFTTEVVALLLVFLGLPIIAGLLFLAHFILTLPMKRAERARLFLNLIDNALEIGRPVEPVLISVAQRRDFSMGVRFHLVTARLEEGERVVEAVSKVPGFLPAAVTAMLGAGQKIGDLRKVLPACRQLLKDAVSQTRGAMSYLVLMAFLVTPAFVFISCVLAVLVLPRFMEIKEGMGVIADTGFPEFIWTHIGLWIWIQIAVLLALWLAVLGRMIGPRLLAWFPVFGEITYRLPWRRKRMQRDFSAMLAVLLDAGVSEAEAVTLAAGCTANVVFQRRAALAINRLQQGATLPNAVKSMDDAGEFGWRLANAIHSHGGFFRALQGWHESLDAQAFQQEQAAAHVVTTGLVLASGVFVGAVVISVFSFLISIINAGVLW
jgi:type II secretory pathway component PulF